MARQRAVKKQARKGRRSSGTSSKSSGGGTLLIGFLVLAAIIAIGSILLFIALIAGLGFIAVTYYKANKTLSPDQAERLASIVYPDYVCTNRKVSAWKTYLKSLSGKNSLKKEIKKMETQIDGFCDSSIFSLLTLLTNRSNLVYRLNAIDEILREPEVYTPISDDFTERAFGRYLERTFEPVFTDAQKLKTENGRKNRYLNYFNRFKSYYSQMDENLKAVLDSYMNKVGISASEVLALEN